MPLEVWIECICPETQFGEDLVIVGNHPVLGNWCLQRAVQLSTSAERFPLWTPKVPLLLEDVEDNDHMPLWLEYKYVIRGKKSDQWEDFGQRSMPIFSSTSAASTNFHVQWAEIGKPLNRLLPFCRGRRLKPGLMLRTDRFGSWAAKTEASWHASRRWGPDKAGMSAALKRSNFTFVSGSMTRREGIEAYAERRSGNLDAVGW
ncbi:unnamed protein product, partial [Effrenium voratum]